MKRNIEVKSVNTENGKYFLGIGIANSSCHCHTKAYLKPPCTNPVQKHPKCIIVNTSKIHCHSRSAHDALSCSICLYIVAADFCTYIGRQWKSGKSIGALNKPRITWTINWQADKTETVAMERHEFQNPSTGLRKHPTKWNEFKYTTASKQQRTCWKSY